jgi:hypothetical protein
MPRPRTDPAVRYLVKVDERGPDECWPWLASCHKNGYGQFHDGVTQVTAHRFGYRTRVGPIPPGQCVLHTCDNPPCQNPDHWFLGTQKNNADDRETKLRGNHPRGVRQGNARLTEEDVMTIRRRYQAGEHATALANAYEVPNSSYIYAIVHGKKWRHLPMVTVTRKRTGNPRLTDDQVREIRRLRASGVPLHLISTQFGTTMSNVSHIALRRTRADVPEYPEGSESSP